MAASTGARLQRKAARTAVSAAPDPSIRKCYGAADNTRLFRKALANRGIRHKRTRPYTPRTNGKAERFIQTSLREWLYARPFQSSAQRTEAMPAWLCDYNTRRPHAALGGKPPISKLKDNVLGNDT